MDFNFYEFKPVMLCNPDISDWIKLPLTGPLRGRGTTGTGSAHGSETDSSNQLKMTKTKVQDVHEK